MNDGADPENIPVWMEGFNLYTETDSAGHFLFEIPDRRQQPGGGLSGDFRLYFYVANYRISTVTVTMLDGILQPDPLVVDEEGQLTESVTLQKLVDIETMIVPESIVESDSVNLKISVTIQPYGSAVLIEAPVTPNEWLLAMIFQNVETGNNEAVFYGQDPSLSSRSIQYQTIWNTQIQSYWLSPRPSLSLEPGLYDVIPFLVIRQEGVPVGLIDQFGENAESFCPEYLNLPVRYKYDQILVMADTTASIMRSG